MGDKRRGISRQYDKESSGGGKADGSVSVCSQVGCSQGDIWTGRGVERKF